VSGCDVRASIINIENDAPGPSDRLLVDTNVWYWTCYSRASLTDHPPERYQSKLYPAYVQEVIAAKGMLLRCAFIFSELCELVERSERQVHNGTLAPGSELTPKGFRHGDSALRAQVRSEVELAWLQVKRLSGVVSCNIGDTTVEQAISGLRAAEIGGHDALILASMANTGITGILTDDSDFATVTGLQVFTANRWIIRAAQPKGLLIAR
jgi:predicted nucleic acid-binding protein